MDAKTLKDLHEKQSVIEKALNKLVSLFGKSKNDAVLTDATGAKLGTVISPDDNLVGKVAVEYDEMGMPTQDPLDDGSYIDDKGNTVVVSGGKGVVESVTPAGGAANSENEALKKEIADLKAAALASANEKTTLTNKITELEAANKATVAAVSEVKNQFDEFKKMVPGDPAKKDQNKEEKITAEAWQKMGLRDRLIHNRLQVLNHSQEK